MRKLFVSMVGLVVALALVFSVRPALAQGVVLQASLLGGAEEVPAPGDPDGYGGYYCSIHPTMVGTVRVVAR